ncbi:MAG: hypothetical protein NTZ50_02905 [Chloroflexi bacterium]|nr:hypothetical protein [Chloroflexota bacterium]
MNRRLPASLHLSRIGWYVLAAFAALVLGVLWQRPGMFVGLNIYDEGIILFGAARVMRGEIPYRDFWTQYSPGQYYFLAGLFSIVGKSVLAARWWDVLVRALLALMLAVLAVRISGWRAGVFIWPLALLWLTYYGFFSYPLFQGLLFSIICLWLFLCGRDDARWNILAGVCFGLTFAFRHDMAAYLGATLVVVRAMDGVLARERIADWLRSWVRFVAGAAVLVLPIALFFGVQVRLSELATQLFIFPLTVFPRVRDLPYPKFTGAVEDLPYYAPFVVYGLTVLMAVIGLLRPKDKSERGRALAMLAAALFGLFGFNQARVRSDLIHTVHFFMLSLPLLPALWRSAASRGRITSWVLGMSAATLFAALLVEPIDAWLKTREQNEVQRVLAAGRRNGPPSAWGLPLQDWQLNLYLSSKFYLQPGEPVYIGLKNHDKVFANDVMSYFLLDRPAVSRYHEMHPGLIETEPVQREIMADLEKARPSVIFVTSMFEGAIEPNDANKSSGVKLLDDYIHEHYIQYGSSGPYEILRRRKGM